MAKTGTEASLDFQDNSQAVKAQFEKNIAKTLTAMGYKWQEIVTKEINTQPQFGHSQGARVTGKGRTNRPGGGMGAVDRGAICLTLPLVSILLADTTFTLYFLDILPILVALIFLPRTALARSRTSSLCMPV